MEAGVQSPPVDARFNLATRQPIRNQSAGLVYALTGARQAAFSTWRLC